MPATRGSLTYVRFYVEGAPPDDFRERYMRSIRHRAMRPLEVDEEELERSGWCAMGEAFATDLSYADVFQDSYVNLGFRTDRWVIPPSIMKRHVREAEKAYMEKKGKEGLSRREKGELKLMVAKKLRRQYTPATRLVDVSWSMNEGLVRFFSHAEKPAGMMQELLTKTFSLKLVPESPYTLAERLGLDRSQTAAWNDLEPTILGEGDLPPAAEEDFAAEAE